MMKIKNFQHTKKAKLSGIPKTQSVFKDTKNQRFLSMKTKRPVVLLILDGWGINKKNTKVNAIEQEGTPNFHKYIKKYPKSAVQAAGEAVGLPKGNQGSSEVGHLNMGAGRIVRQSLVRINNSIKDSSFFRNREFIASIKNCKKHRTRLHLIGLLQDQGVHAHQEHLFALLKLCKQQRFKDVLIHVFTDGRDTLPNSAKIFISRLNRELRKNRFGKIVTVMGRYYSMDRDNRWQRTRLAFEAIASGRGLKAENAIKAVNNSYKKDVSDEFIKPTVIGDYSGVNDNDSVIFYNYRFDRIRQLAKCFVLDKFSFFRRGKRPKTFFVAMMEYYKGISAAVAFKPVNIKNRLGEVLAKNGIRQLRISETEKYAHVTFFFNGLVEKPNKGEDRILIYSPKVATYDLKPEMSSYKITDRLVKELKTRKYDCIICNIVNGDMVGHTGVWRAALKAVEAVDNNIKRIVDTVFELNGFVLIGADHGNIEFMKNADGTPNTAHTTNNVYFILCCNDYKRYALRRQGVLADIAPTILKLLKINKPIEMTGKSLVV